MPGAGGTDHGHGQPSRPRVKCGVLGTGPVAEKLVQKPSGGPWVGVPPVG